MVEYGDLPGDGDDGRGSNWNSIIIRHSTAWFLLLLLILIIWKMANPIMGDKNTGDIAANESTMTAAEQTVTPPSVVVAGTTTTTARPTPEPQIKLPSGKDRVQVVAKVLLMRSSPSKKGKAIGKLSRGTIVAVESREDGWLKVRTVNNDVGYVSGSSELVRPAP